jgi:DNA repair exonuclease SbcCD ATPase subunit
MSSKTYKRYPASDALKKGSPSTIEGACTKKIISQEYVELREKYKRLKIDNQKSNVKLEQMDQLRKDNDTKLIQLSKKNDTINKLHITITQLNNQIKVLKETSVDRGDAQRLEGFIKKKDHEIEELKKQIDSTKINALAVLENEMAYLKKGRTTDYEEIKTLKAEIIKLKDELKKDNPQSRFDMIRVLSDDIEKVMKENTDLKTERDGYKGLAEEWCEQSNEICNLMGKSTDGWSNIAGDTLIDVKDLLNEMNTLEEENTQLKKDNETLKGEHGEIIQKLDKIQNGITLLFDDF